MIVYLVGVEVRGSDVDVEQVVTTGELQWSGLRQRAGAGLQDVGDVLGAEGLKGESVDDGAGHDIGGEDLGPRPALPDLVAGADTLLPPAVAISCRIPPRRPEHPHSQPLPR